MSHTHWRLSGAPSWLPAAPWALEVETQLECGPGLLGGLGAPHPAALPEHRRAWTVGSLLRSGTGPPWSQRASGPHPSHKRGEEIGLCPGLVPQSLEGRTSPAGTGQFSAHLPQCSRGTCKCQRPCPGVGWGRPSPCPYRPESTCFPASGKRRSDVPQALRGREDTHHGGLGL